MLLVLLALGFLYFFHSAIYDRYVFFPKQRAAIEHLKKGRIGIPIDIPWKEYRGVMHAHSHLSHDSEATFEEILAALKQCRCDFICLTDHPEDGKGDYSLAWRGLHDGVLFVPGFEMANGFMPWGLPPDTVLDNSEEPHALAKRVKDLGGVLFFAHCEQPRPWDIQELTGMEIYNIHVDLKDEKIAGLLPDILLNMGKYPDEVFRMVFDRPAAFLKRWDEENNVRRLTGIAANDTHQNCGVRGVYTDSGTLCLYDTGHKDRVLEVGGLSCNFPMNFLTRPIARMLWGPLEPNRQLFRIEVDPYPRSVRFVNTHVLASELSEPALMDALRASRVFVAFDGLADARGFVFVAGSAAGSTAVMGETAALVPGLLLRAASPLPCRMRLLLDGKPVREQVGSIFEYEPVEPGKYRLEAELDILGRWVPWVFTNPIELTRAQ